MNQIGFYIELIVYPLVIFFILDFRELYCSDYFLGIEMLYSIKKVEILLTITKDFHEKRESNSDESDKPEMVCIES